MPLTFKTTIAPAKEPSFLERMGGVRGLLGTGTRAVSGMAALGGHVPGAFIAGSGELLAELIEGSRLNPARIGTEAALGAVPFTKLLRAGRPLASAVRGGLYAGTGAAMREKAEGQDLDPTAIASSAATGGLLNAGLAKLLGMSAPRIPPVAPVVPKMTGWSEPTAQAAAEIEARYPITEKPRLLTKGVQTALKQTFPMEGSIHTTAKTPTIEQIVNEQQRLKGALGGAPYKSEAEIIKDRIAAVRAENVYRDEQAAAKTIGAAKLGLTPGAPKVSESISAPLEGGGTERMTIGYKRGKTPTGAMPVPAEAIQIPAVMSTEEIARMEEAWQRSVARNPDLAQATMSELPQEVAAAIPVQDASPLATMMRVVPTGKSQTQKFDAKVAKILRDVEQGVPGEHVIAPEVVSAAQAAPEAAAAPQVAPAVSKLLGVEPVPITEPKSGIFTTRAGASGLNTRRAKEALARGEITPETYADIRKRHLAVLGKTEAVPATVAIPESNDAYLARFAKMSPAEKAAEKARLVAEEGAAPIGQGIAGAAVTNADQQTIEANKDILSRMQKMRGDRGAVSPLLLARLGLGVAGAVGGATLTPDHPLMGAALGGMAGAALPSLPSTIKALTDMGAHPAAMQHLEEAVKTPEGLKEAALRIGRTLPQVQRFNYLADIWGLPANAFFGPWGSAFFGSLEHALKGDPRGLAAMRLLNPLKFARSTVNSFHEAGKLIGRSERAEGQLIGEAGSRFGEAMASPGTLMAAGDYAARNILMQAGFTEAEARIITLTSEPEAPFTRGLAEWGKKSPLAQFLFPFRRTPANILEQGARRVPLLGLVTQLARKEAADPLTTQLLQQGLGLGVGSASGVLGASLDPESARIARRYVSNVGGQYSLPASIGFAMGQAAHKGRPPVSGALAEAAYALPLPTAEPISEWSKFLARLAGALPPEAAPIPRGAYPRFIDQFQEVPVLGPKPAPVPPMPPSRLRFRSP